MKRNRVKTNFWGPYIVMFIKLNVQSKDSTCKERGQNQFTTINDTSKNYGFRDFFYKKN